MNRGVVVLALGVWMVGTGASAADRNGAANETVVELLDAGAGEARMGEVALALIKAGFKVGAQAKAVKQKVVTEVYFAPGHEQKAMAVAKAVGARADCVYPLTWKGLGAIVVALAGEANAEQGKAGGKAVPSPTEFVRRIAAPHCPIDKVWEELGLAGTMPKGWFQKGEWGCESKQVEFDLGKPFGKCVVVQSSQANDFQLMVFLQTKTGWRSLGVINVPGQRYGLSAPRIQWTGTVPWLVLDQSCGGGSGVSCTEATWYALRDGVPRAMTILRDGHVSAWGSIDHEQVTEMVRAGETRGQPTVELSTRASFTGRDSAGTVELFSFRRRTLMAWSDDGGFLPDPARSETVPAELDALWGFGDAEILEEFYGELMRLAIQGTPRQKAWLRQFAREPRGSRAAQLMRQLETILDGGTPSGDPPPTEHVLNAQIKGVTASTTLRGFDEYDFSAKNILDGQLDTSWQPAPQKGGVGEWVRVEFAEEVQVDGLAVANGFQRHDRLGDLFILNNRLAKARVEFSDGASQEIVLDGNRRGFQQLMLRPVKTKSLRLVALAVARGARWSDLALSELVVLGEEASPKPTAPSRLVAPGLGQCPPGMAWVGGGTFQMMESRAEAKVRPFCLDVTEVTVDAYADCVGSGKCSDEELDCSGHSPNWKVPGRENHPVNCVDWDQARAYCAAVGKRLPSEEEWEWAARGEQNASTYPWGESAPAWQLCWNGEGSELGLGNRVSTCAVGSFPSGDSPQGIHDLAGNVEEWTASQEVCRGGSWRSLRRWSTRAGRSSHAWTQSHLPDLGIRCAGPPEGSGESAAPPPQAPVRPAKLEGPDAGAQ